MRSLGNRTARPGLCLLALAAALGGCDAVEDALTPRDSEEARAAVESMALTRLEATLLMAVAEQIPAGEMPSAIAPAVAMALPMVFTPADCVESEVVDATLTMTLDGCTGPRALSVSGTAAVVFTAADDDGATLNLTATGLEIGDATMTINATADYAPQPLGAHRASVTTEGVGTTPDDLIVGRLGTYDIEWSDACFSIDGEWSSSLDDEIFLTSVDDYYGCDAFCPAAGTIVYGRTRATGADDIQGTALTITYLGDTGAPWVATDGAFGRQELQCTEDPDGREPPGSGGDDDDLDD